MPHLAMLLALVPQGDEPFPPTPFDRVIPLVIEEQDPVLAGHGRAERVTYEAEFEGTLQLWTRSAGELDLLLRVETPSGELVRGNDNTGRVKTPYFRLPVQPGRELVIICALSKGEALGRFEQCTIAAPESEATRALAEGASDAIDELRSQGEAIDPDARRRRADWDEQA